MRHIAIDDFLVPDFADKLYLDFPTSDSMPKSRDYVFSDKHELSTLDRHSEASRQLHEVFTSSAFADFLLPFSGSPVFVDPEYVGGGFHAGSAHSYLDMHVDFNVHPAHRNWLRRFNILFYLNPGWSPSWGGELLLTDKPGNATVAVEPKMNRLVIMESTDSSYHGYEPLNFPSDRTRRSIAAYAYSVIDPGSVTRHTTNWAPREGTVAKKILARNWNWMVLTKNKFLGSGTLKNRR